MEPVVYLLQQAAQLAGIGEIDTAERIYRAILDEQPCHVDALLRLGLLLYRQGRQRQAVQCLQLVVVQAPQDANANGVLATALADLDRPGEAATIFRRCIVLQPELTDNHLGLGCTLNDLGRLTEAAEALRHAVQLAPEIAEGYVRLGVVLDSLGKDGEARKAYGRALAIDPSMTKAYSDLAINLAKQGCVVEAIAINRRALETDPADSRIHSNLGNALQRLGRIDEAISAYRTAVTIDPFFADVHYNLGTALNRQERHAEAIGCYRSAIASKPGFAEAYDNLGASLYRLADDGKAITAHRQAIALAPSAPDAHFNLAHALLRSGQLAEGFEEWEWRWQSLNFPSPRRDFSQPMWDGRAFVGKTLLVHSEQGYGDTLQFCRYLPLAAQFGGRIIVESAAPLCELLRQLPGVAAVIESGQELPPFDLHLPIYSLPFACRSARTPTNLPYLRADAGRAAAWRSRLRHQGRLAVGLVWAGNPRQGNDRHRSLAFRHLASLSWPENIALYSLQKGDARRQLADQSILPPITDLGEEIRDFADLAAVVDGMDLIITVCTAMAHLAGAMGKTVWTLLSFAPDWRWQLAGSTTDWYPTMRLFRQRTAGDWPGVMADLSAALDARFARQELLGKSGRSSSPTHRLAKKS